MTIALGRGTQPRQATFETAAMKGLLESEGTEHGIRAVELAAGGTRPINPSLYLGHVYRLLADGRYLMTAREHPHRGEVGPEKVVCRWEPSEVHPGHLEIEWQVSGDQTIDLTVTARPTAPLARYEVYLSHYFAPAWRPYVYLRPAPYLRSEEPVLWAPEVCELFRGYYLAFPRDDQALAVLFDGRWHGDHPVPWGVGRCFHAPVAIYASTIERQAVVVTARRSECFCLYTTYHSPDGRDNILHHNSLYFGLFGQDLGPGDERVGHLRYHFVAWDTTDDLPLQLHAAWDRAE